MLGAQQLIETVYQLVSRSDAETLRFLRDVIVLAVHANPDGHELVANWYMRERDPLRRTLAGRAARCTRSTSATTTTATSTCRRQAETINMNRVLYQEWFPQIVYNHHQTGPAGTVMFAPPFRDPFNYVFDPLIPSGIDLVGAAMHARFAAEGKPGVTMRRGSNVLDLVERRAADDGVLPQPDRAADRDDRQPDADRDSVRAGAAAAERATCRIRSRRSGGTSASRSTTR